MSAYRRFLEGKIKLAPSSGFDVADSEINPLLKPHQRAIVRWALRGGRRAIFGAFGLGKTPIQIEIMRLRDESERRLGTDFAIKEFHDTMLVNGAMLLPMLEIAVEEWIQGVT